MRSSPSTCGCWCRPWPRSAQRCWPASCWAFMNAWIGVALALWLVVAGWGIALRRGGAGRGRRRCGAPMRWKRCAPAPIDLVSGQTDLVMAGRIDAQRARWPPPTCHLANADHALNRLETRAGIGLRPWPAPCAGGSAAGGCRAGAARARSAAPVAALACWSRSRRSNPSQRYAAARWKPAGRWLAARRIAPRLAPRPDHGGGAGVAGRAMTPAWRCASRASFAAHPGSRTPALRDIELTLDRRRAGRLIGPQRRRQVDLAGPGRRRVRRPAGEVRAATALPADAADGAFPRQPARQPPPGRSGRRAMPGSGPSCTPPAWRRKSRAMAAGLDTPLGEGGLGLSGGQSRRLALARLVAARHAALAAGRADRRHWTLRPPTMCCSASMPRRRPHAAGRHPSAARGGAGRPADRRMQDGRIRTAGSATSAALDGFDAALSSACAAPRH